MTSSPPPAPSSSSIPLICLAGILLIAVIAAVIYIERLPEQTYKGRPVSEWVNLTKDADGQTQEAALDAIYGSGADDIPQFKSIAYKAFRQGPPSLTVRTAWSSNAMNAEDQKRLADAIMQISGDPSATPTSVSRAASALSYVEARHTGSIVKDFIDKVNANPAISEVERSSIIEEANRSLAMK
jgi:hypothetical protein